MMEVFAGFTAHTDHEIGRVFDALRASGAYENTLIVYSVGDNGASGEGGMQGIVNGMSYFNGQVESLNDMLDRMEGLGGPSLFNNFPAGWAWAMDTPFRWIKKAAGHLGGVRNPLVVSWPQRIKNRGGLRSQFIHCVDVAPTILEATGIRMPEILHGQTQRPLDGNSFAYTFDDPLAPERHTRQYFEALGNRGIYADGWWAGVLEGLPWEPTKKLDLEASRWELYHLEQDFTQARDLATEQPQKLREMKELFMAEARRNQVLPLDTATNEKMAAAQALAGGPVRDSFTFFAGTVGLFEAAAPNIKNRSFRMTADVVLPPLGAQGVLVAMGGRFGGYSLFVRGDRLHYWYNNSGLEQTCVSTNKPLPQGRCSLGLDFSYDGGGQGKGGVVRLFVDGDCIGSGRLERTVPRIFARETFDVGMDLNSPVADYEAPFAFNGVIERLVVHLL